MFIVGESFFSKILSTVYSLGYFAWDGMTARPDECIIDQEKLAVDHEVSLANMTKISKEIRNAKIPTFEEFLYDLKRSMYHEMGHRAVGYCQDTNSPMLYSQMSARDPIFYRWHAHISNFIMEMTNKILPG